MNLDLVRPINETEELILSIIENCQMLIKQTHREAEETLEIKVVQPRETFHFNPPISIEGSWMIRLTSFEVYNPILNITEINNEFELDTDTLMSFHLKSHKMILKRSLILQILHHLIYNMKKLDHVLLKHIRNYDWKT